MMHPNLYRKPVMLDTNTHRDLKVARPTDDWSMASGVNAIAVAALEFADAAVDFPIVFVQIPNANGVPELVPAAIFGLTAGENLYVQGTSWRARYVPALLRMYPFGVAGIEGDQVMIAIDEDWPGWSRTEGEPVFEASGEPTERTQALVNEIGKVAGEVVRGPELGKLLSDAGLLVDTRFEASTPEGEKITVDGFYAVDARKLAEIDDAKALEFVRSGVMALIHAHQISMRHMPKLVTWRIEQRQAAAGAAAPAASPAPAPAPGPSAAA